MLLSIQFPIADARSFVCSKRLAAPTWPAPNIEQPEFVHQFGPTKHRKNGPIDVNIWDDEAYYADAKAALRLPEMGTFWGSRGIKTMAIFRRLFCADYCSRVEVTLSLSIQKHLSGESLLSLVEDFLKLPTRFFRHYAQEEKSLLSQGENLANLFAESTVPVTVSTDATLVAPCTPTVIVVYDQKEVDNLFTTSRYLIDATALTGKDVILHYLPPSHNNAGKVGIWFIGDHGDAPSSLTRYLRLCLFRLHSERQVFAQILRWVVAHKITHDVAGDGLEDYLNKTTKYLFKKTCYGFSKNPLRKILEIQDLALPLGSSDALLQLLEKVRRQVLKKIRLII